MATSLYICKHFHGLTVPFIPLLNISTFASKFSVPEMAESNEAVKPSLLNIPWADILFCHIFSELSPKDLFNLRAVSKDLKNLVKEYFKWNKFLDFSTVSGTITCQAFKIATEDSTNLRYMDLCNCKWLDSTVLDPVLEKNRNLQYLNISSCFSVSNSSLQLLAINAPNLCGLNLNKCHWTSAGAIISIALHCHLLEDINLTSCWEVTDEAICELVLRCPKLRTLSVARIYGITDRTLVVLAHKASNLENLDVTGCWRVTDYGIRLVGEYCKQLKFLKVEDCRAVTEISLQALRSRLNVDPRRRDSYQYRPRVQVQI